MFKKSLNNFFRITRNGFKTSDASQNCGWEDIIAQASCKKERELLNTSEELKTCTPSPVKGIEAPREEEDLRSVNGVPEDAFRRNTVMIKRQTKHCMQSGTANTHAWLIHYYTEDVNWENPLMGWNSGANGLKDVEIKFPDIESAVQYAEKNGWSYIIPKHGEKKTIPKKNYGLGFSWNRRNRVSTR